MVWQCHTKSLVADLECYATVGSCTDRVKYYWRPFLLSPSRSAANIRTVSDDSNALLISVGTSLKGNPCSCGIENHEHGQLVGFLSHLLHLIEHFRAKIVLAPASTGSCPMTFLVGRGESPYLLDGARSILLLPGFVMQTPNVRECQIPKVVLVFHGFSCKSVGGREGEVLFSGRELEECLDWILSAFLSYHYHPHRLPFGSKGKWP